MSDKNLLILEKINHKSILKNYPHKHLGSQLLQLSKSAELDDGFSMIEIITVVMIIGILAAISLPSWFAFVNRQTVNKANEAVFAAIQEAQIQAKQKKLSYSVSFKLDGQVPKVVIHPDSESASSIANNRWQSLGEKTGNNFSKITLLTNLTSKNTFGSSISAISTTPQTVTFDYMGTLPGFATPSSGSTESTGIKVVVSASNIRRCVVIKTILGSMLSQKDAACS